MQFSRPEDGEVAGLQRQITGLLVIDEPEIGVRMVSTVPAVGVRAHADPLLAAQQQLDVQILLMKLAPAIRHRLCQILAHQAEQQEVDGLMLFCLVSEDLTEPVIMRFASLDISVVYLCAPMKKDH